MKMTFLLVQRLIATRCGGSRNLGVTRIIENLFTSLPSTNSILSRYSISQNIFLKCSFHSKVPNFNNTNSSKGVQENISALQAKKRLVRRKKLTVGKEEAPVAGVWNVKALGTAEEYNLESLEAGLLDQQLYIPHKICTSTNLLSDVIHAIAKYDVGGEPREIFFFREGTVVIWNTTELETENILQFLRKFEENSYLSELTQAESEVMTYTYTESGKKCHIKEDRIVLTRNATNLEKYTFSNAMAQSVKLGIWEASLDHYVHSIQFVTEDLKVGRKLRMSQRDVLRKQGEVFALKHQINLSSDLLDTPDFYWERDDLERLYRQTYNYFNITKRIRVINEKLNHCVELVGLLSSHLSDRHHIRLEWMIIVLIMVEVVFEILHYIDRYLVK